MLKHLHIRNFAIVENLELVFESGMTVLSGETGAGKSILLGALGLTLGDRADSGVVRHGNERSEISATFTTDDVPAIERWLAEREMDMEGECIIRRTINADGGSRGYINGQPMPIQSLRELGEQLVDIHGQHAHQSLLKRRMQRQLLDDFSASSDLVTEVNDGYRAWQKLQEEHKLLQQASDEREARLELLRYQVDELVSLELSVDEIARLDEEHRRLSNASQLLERAEGVLNRLYDSDELSLVTQLERTVTELQLLQQLDERIDPARELLENAAIQAREAATEVRHYLDTLELDPQRLEEVEQRLAILFDLSRKHHIDAQELPALLEKLQQELTVLEAAETRLDGMELSITEAEKAYLNVAKQLSAIREKAAAKLETLITANMQELGMEGGRFAIVLERIAPTSHGLEQVEFQVSANPGQPLRPLSKVASGGELSRISLAIQVIAAGREGIPTLIFDEVDVGVGGGIAERVGRQLRTLGSERQVLCVTHQPQVAALAHHHFQISKHSSDDSTETRVEVLQSAERIAEVARMLGGVEITDQTLSHAQEMIELAQSS
jgi:DNA repair protein RecN (Recombination protein N)